MESSYILSVVSWHLNQICGSLLNFCSCWESEYNFCQPPYNLNNELTMAGRDKPMHYKFIHDNQVRRLYILSGNIMHRPAVPAPVSKVSKTQGGEQPTFGGIFHIRICIFMGRNFAPKAEFPWNGTAAGLLLLCLCMNIPALGHFNGRDYYDNALITLGARRFLRVHSVSALCLSHKHY